jgi:hypothetical protein
MSWPMQCRYETSVCVGEDVGEVVVLGICIAQRLLAFRGNRKQDLGFLNRILLDCVF